MRTALVITALGGALALPGSFVASAHAQAPAADHPDINGAWVLNRDVGDQMQRGGGGGESGDGGGGGGHRHGGGGYGVSAMGRGGGMGGGGQMSEEQKQEMERRRALMKELLQPSDRMTVTVESDIVTFTESDGRVRKFKTDGKKEKHQFDNGTVETKSKWDNGGLVIETDLQNGMKLTQTYTGRSNGSDGSDGSLQQEPVAEREQRSAQHDGDERPALAERHLTPAMQGARRERRSEMVQPRPPARRLTAVADVVLAEALRQQRLFPPDDARVVRAEDSERHGQHPQQA
jgi:hypothetical protein